MMTKLQMSGELTASSLPDRTLTYRMLPFGEPGRTSLGTVTVAPGVVAVPDPATVVLNLQHDRSRPLGRATTVWADHGAMHATFTIANTSGGDDLLAEVEAGLRTGVSVELSDVTIRNGALTAGTLTGAAAVTHPAFPSALIASDTEPDITPEPATDPVPEPTPNEDPMPETETPAPVASAPVLTAARTAPVLTASVVFQMLGERDRGTASPELLAALSDITATANAVVAPPQWLAELWSGDPYVRQVVPLLRGQQLTSLTAVGWRYKVRPVGSTYAGDKADIPSNAATTEAATTQATRFAGGHDHDRAMRDFNPAGYWEGYWRAMVDSYAEWSDDLAATALVAAAPTVAPTGTGVVNAIVSGVLAVKGGPATFCLMGHSAYAQMAEVDPLAFLSGSLTLPTKDGSVGGLQFQASAKVPTDHVIVGNRKAMTFYELGSTPLRVETVNIPQGGIDTAAFGYAATIVNWTQALAEVTVADPAPVAARK